MMLGALLVLTATSVISPNTVEADEPPVPPPAWEQGDPIPDLSSSKETHDAYVEWAKAVVEHAKQQVETAETAVADVIGAANAKMAEIVEMGAPPAPVGEDGLEPTQAQIQAWNEEFDAWIADLSDADKAKYDALVVEMTALTASLAAKDAELKTRKDGLELDEKVLTDAEKQRTEHCNKLSDPTLPPEDEEDF
ncbi:MAG: hypothetical protein L3J82_09770 [Planctomycetes bacterium]|nr:hypothetical protein [Planctomycetota bacterium]